MLRTVRFVNGVRPSKKWSVNEQVYSSYCTNCHVHALFVKGHRLAASSHIHELDVVSPWACFESLAKLESLACRGLQVMQVRTPPLTSAYHGQAQSYPIVNPFSLINCPYTCTCICCSCCVRTCACACMANLAGAGLQ